MKKLLLIVLAFDSPRRKQLLKHLGLKFKVFKSCIDETEVI